MPTKIRQLTARCLVAVMAIGGLAATSPADTAGAAANVPWSLPTVPPRCSSTQMDIGLVAGCVIGAGQGLPEDKGWPAPPFPSSGGTFPPRTTA